MVGIIILNYMTYEKTIECVSSIMQSEITDYMIYIVDNASPNNSYQYLTEEYVSCKNIKVLKTKRNAGYANGNNFGIYEAMKSNIESVVITNNDIIFTKDAISNLYQFICNNKDAVIVGPRIYTQSGKVQHSSLLKKNSLIDVMGLHFLSPKKKADILEEEKAQKAEKVYIVSGCCIIVSVSKFKKMGGFDTNTFLYNEENILGCQAEKNNYSIYFLPSATVIHDHGATTGKKNLFVAQELLTSSLYYWRAYRNGNRFELLAIFIMHIIKELIKSIYIKECRKGWKQFIRRSWKALNKEIRSISVIAK